MIIDYIWFLFLLFIIPFLIKKIRKIIKKFFRNLWYKIIINKNIRKKIKKRVDKRIDEKGKEAFGMLTASLLPYYQNSLKQQGILKEKLESGGKNDFVPGQKNTFHS